MVTHVHYVLETAKRHCLRVPSDLMSFIAPCMGILALNGSMGFSVNLAPKTMMISRKHNH
jgi:hypothetical protein